MKPIKMLPHGAALMCLLGSLTGCASKPIVEYRTVEVKVPVTVPVDAELVKVVPEPKLAAGTVTNDDLAALIEALQAWGRGMAGQLREIGELGHDHE